MNFLSPRRRRKTYSVEKLRVAYADLLDHIGLSNDDLGRRGIDEIDADCQRRSRRFSFRRRVIPSSNASVTPSMAEEISINEENTKTFQRDSSLLGEQKQHREMISAFRMMAATRSPDKEGDNFGAAAVREDSYVAAISAARAIESRVVELIQKIGEIFVHSEDWVIDCKDSPDSNNQARSDPIFEYFCEKSILSLLVDIAKEKRQTSEEGRRWEKTSFYHGVVWSPEVKAQVFSTVALWISDARRPSDLYYFLSQNYVNDLIQCMLPLEQWTEQALSKMMPPYVEMLQKIAIKLADDPTLFPFLTIESQKSRNRGDKSDRDTEVQSDRTTEFPLFSAVLEAATGAYAKSDSIFYGTCLVIAVNIMQIPSDPIQAWVCNSGFEQKRLADHLCQRLLDRYHRIVNITTGPVVDAVRSNAIAGQFAGLRDHMNTIHEVFWSGVRGLDVRLCESLLQRVVTVLLRNLATHRKRSFLSCVGLLDSDVIPEQEALAQVSSIFLAFLFSALAYVPFQRMLAVALFHEKSTPLWFSSTKWIKDSSETYIFMPLLSDIVTGDQERETCQNSFQIELRKGISGKYGEWRTIACACLLQAALASEAMDGDSLRRLELVPSYSQDSKLYHPSTIEEAVAEFLTRKHEPSAVTMQALEYVGFLSLQLLQKALEHFGDGDTDRVAFFMHHSVVWKALNQARAYFATQAHSYKKITGVSDIFLDLIESAVQARYTSGYSENGKVLYRCPLSQHGCSASGIPPDALVRKFRGVGSNDVEACRFYIHLTLHFRILGRLSQRLGKTSLVPSQSTEQTFESSCNLSDEADDLIRNIGGLSAVPKLGSEIDLTGRMTFRCSAPRACDEKRNEKGASSSIRSLARESGISKSDSVLILVLDPSDVFIAKPSNDTDETNRATILCHVPLRNVIAAAADGHWLHVAVRHGDVKLLIKNGNLALQLESAGSCLVVKQYLDRSREILRQELLRKANELLLEAGATDFGLRKEEVEEKKSSE